MTDLSDLESRVRLLEDQLSLIQLISEYGPSVDSGSHAEAANLWVEDGTYDAGNVHGAGPQLWRGAEEIVGMLDGPLHQSLIQRGCGHLTGIPRIKIDGDTADGTGYSILFAYREESHDFAVLRVTATQWSFVRARGQWRVRERINRNLDGDEAARALFRSAVSRWPRHS